MQYLPLVLQYVGLGTAILGLTGLFTKADQLGDAGIPYRSNPMVWLWSAVALLGALLASISVTL